jgi:hypothetical protein
MVTTAARPRGPGPAHIWKQGCQSVPHGIYHPKSGIYHLRYIPWYMPKSKMIYSTVYTIAIWHGIYHCNDGIYLHGMVYTITMMLYTIFHTVVYISYTKIYTMVYQMVHTLLSDGIYLARYHGIYMEYITFPCTVYTIMHTTFFVSWYKPWYIS